MKDVDGVMEMQLLLVMEGELRVLMNLIREYIAYITKLLCIDPHDCSQIAIIWVLLWWLRVNCTRDAGMLFVYLICFLLHDVLRSGNTVLTQTSCISYIMTDTTEAVPTGIRQEK